MIKFATCKHCGELMNEPSGEHRCGQRVKTVNAIAESTPELPTASTPEAPEEVLVIETETATEEVSETSDDSQVDADATDDSDSE